MATTSRRNDKSIAAVKQSFKDAGVFYTDEALALYIKSFIPEGVSEVYDPTCGGGALLAVFGDEVAKYGQEIDEQQAMETSDSLVNCHIVQGDTLRNPAFADKRFQAIVANPPFSIKWSPEDVNDNDARFCDAPCLPPPSKADYAFLLHIFHYLAEDGTAAVLNFPGILYRGQREGKIRKWLIEQNCIDRVELIEKGHFADTNITTALIVMRKNRTEDYITMRDGESRMEGKVPLCDVADNGYNLSPTSYLQQEKEEVVVNPRVLENKARTHAINVIENEIKMSILVSQFEGWEFSDFLDDIQSIVSKYRDEKNILDLNPPFEVPEEKAPPLHLFNF